MTLILNQTKLHKNLVYKAYLKLFFVKLDDNKKSILDRAWLISLTLLIAMHLVDIQYFDIRISSTFWILLAGLREIIKENANYSLDLK